MPNADKSSSLKLRINTLNWENGKLKQIEITGTLPDSALRKDVKFIVSFFDCADGGIHPILSNVPLLQEPFTLAYQSQESVRENFHESRGISYWLPIGAFIPEFVMGPYSGKRKIEAVVRLIDVDDPAHIAGGEVIGGFDALLWTGKIRFNYPLYGVGYIQLAKQRRRIESIVLRLATAVALSDGTLDSEEIQTLQERLDYWSTEARFNFDGLSEQQRSTSYKGMMSRALAKARANELDVTSLLKSMRRSAGETFWHEALELCYNVTSANGIAHASQLRLLRQIADSSGLDPRELAKLRDQKIIDFGITSRVASPTDELLGIDSSWDVAKIRRHLRKEYRKWNGRLNTIPEGEARKNAQGVLNMIGEAYKNYMSPKPTPTADQPMKTVSTTETTSKTLPDTEQTSKTDPHGRQLDLFGDLA
ncbi:MAG: hypothetical protein OXI05_00535 [Bacteroidota bacterium]|nr:hypothetical protein [Bacteroidota bacterium]MXW14508.1 TerB family tellurite resistance protein [Rhodothermaceae bacterium]MXZ17140.1 TerB family tellurite resistance protein [Rhodothermaceae bacterium]MYC03165.1 TerB family tellurite resistance protein [Rhodothermaceae bacterium]MYG70079.1 TerB family tellurite resistance protein [Rhodothermaceae bacterium]